MRGLPSTSSKSFNGRASSSQVHLPRWGRTLGIDLVERLVFLPHLPHSEMLLVVANCKAMLDTFPWGGGVTSLEALLAGVPVVTLPARISVLPLAAGQVLIAIGREMNSRVIFRGYMYCLLGIIDGEGEHCTTSID